MTDDTPALHLSEAVVGGLVVVVAVLSWASLALAHLHRHSLVAVCVVSTLAVAGLAALLRRTRVTVRVDVGGLAVTGAVGLLALVMFLPGFPFGASDKDPGGYVQHAIVMANHGSYSLHDPVLDKNRIPAVQLSSPGARLAGVWIKDAQRQLIVPQFYHLWPALMATAYDAGGVGGLTSTTPVVGALAVMALCLALRRVAEAAAPTVRGVGLVTGGLGGGLLAVNMLEVWQAKVPSTEVFAQLLFVGALLGVIVALCTAWHPPALAAGLFVGLSFLNRPDGVLLLLLSAAVGGVLLATGRWESHCRWYAVGVGVTVPHAFWQAYSAARLYSVGNRLPSATKVVALVVLALGGGALLRRFVPRLGGWVADRLVDRRWQTWLGRLVAAAVLSGLAVGFLRRRLFGVDMTHYLGRPIRSFDELIFPRLSWFVTRPGFLAMAIGVLLVTLRRWRAPAWALLIPTLTLLPIYGYTSRNSTRLMFWNRRYVPTALPCIVALIAIALGWALTRPGARRVLWRIPAVLLAAYLGVFSMSQSLPLRGHRELGGTFTLSARIAALAGERQGVFLWEVPACCAPHPTNLFAGPVWLERDQVSALIPTPVGRRDSYVRSFVRGFPGQPVFVVWAGTARPPGLGALGLEVAEHVVTPLRAWEQSDDHRPRRAVTSRLDFTVWRVS